MYSCGITVCAQFEISDIIDVDAKDDEVAEAFLGFIADCFNEYVDELIYEDGEIRVVYEPEYGGRPDSLLELFLDQRSDELQQLLEIDLPENGRWLLIWANDAWEVLECPEKSEALYAKLAGAKYALWGSDVLEGVHK